LNQKGPEKMAHIKCTEFCRHRLSHTEASVGSKDDRSSAAKVLRVLSCISLAIALSGCAGLRTVDQSVGHIDDAAPTVASMKPIVDKPPVLPEPEPLPPVETYTVVAKDVPVTDLLFSLARDAGLDLDIQADNERTITINAVEQPLSNILARIADQAGLRFELNATNLVVQEDLPYWHNYMVDYVNVSRNSVGEVGVATQIATTGGSVAEESSGGQQQDRNGNLSKTTVTNKSSNDFWDVVQKSLQSLVRGDQREQSAVSSPAEFDPIIVNPMAGVITVLATQKDHKEVQRYLDKVAANVQRQVLIEMTIVEVELSDRYQAGVDWQRLSDGAGTGSNGISVEADLLGANLSTSPFVSLGFNGFDADGSGISAAVRLLQQFGDTKVLSSPKIMALNNQTALLKVVNEEVFFSIELDIREATTNIPERRTFTSEIHTVPVGLVLSVTPQISEKGYVSLNIRPTISRITGFAIDPAPRLADAEFDNLIPEIQVREIESLLQVFDGRTIVLGGLMQNEIVKSKDGVPGLSRIPKIGGLFSYNSDELVKTELVIFLRPTIVSGAESPLGTKGIRDYYPEISGSAGN
jgi:general secretion pathway protein D